MPCVLLLVLFCHYGGIQLHHGAHRKVPGALVHCELEDFPGAVILLTPIIRVKSMKTTVFFTVVHSLVF